MFFESIMFKTFNIFFSNAKVFYIKINFICLMKNCQTNDVNLKLITLKIFE